MTTGAAASDLCELNGMRIHASGVLAKGQIALCTQSQVETAPSVEDLFDSAPGESTLQVEDCAHLIDSVPRFGVASGTLDSGVLKMARFDERQLHEPSLPVRSAVAPADPIMAREIHRLQEMYPSATVVARRSGGTAVITVVHRRDRLPAGLSEVEAGEQGTAIRHRISRYTARDVRVARQSIVSPEDEALVAFGEYSENAGEPVVTATYLFDTVRIRSRFRHVRPGLLELSFLVTADKNALD